ncbi:MAG: hypothetical protein JXA64_06615 [Candidatus Fermentibacteraceae bacterium]|nr:hypothetical protein [Candidatus Fermentibacteraceae bacterium]MBN2608770.1 hypothetical protein [Candidatus Fermentibacteraceae bacterium]
MGRTVMLSAVALILVLSCGGSVSGNMVNLDQPFLLCSGERVKVLDADLEVEATSVIDGLDGSMETGVGSVYLLVDHGTEKDIEVYLETGGWKTLGEYELHFIEVTANAEGMTSARLLVR